MYALKKYGLLLLVTLLLASTFSTALVSTAFNLNKEYIIRQLCENRFRPEMKCHGKCYLKKHLQKSQSSPTKDEPQSRQEIKLNWLAAGLLHFSFEQGSSLYTPVQPVFILPSAYTAPIDHPPSV